MSYGVRKQILGSYLFKSIDFNGHKGFIMFKLSISDLMVFPRIVFKVDKMEKPYWINIPLLDMLEIFEGWLEFLNNVDTTKPKEVLEYRVKSNDKTWIFGIGHNGEEFVLTVMINNAKTIDFTFREKKIFSYKNGKASELLDYSKIKLIRYVKCCLNGLHSVLNTIEERIEKEKDDATV